MQRRQFTSGVFFTGALVVGPIRAAGFSESDAVLGVRSALERGANAAVDLLGRSDGFLGNPKVRIPLPGFLNDAAKLLKATGGQKKVDELVTAMNRAAEAAVPLTRWDVPYAHLPRAQSTKHEIVLQVHRHNEVVLGHEQPLPPSRICLPGSARKRRSA